MQTVIPSERGLQEVSTRVESLPCNELALNANAYDIRQQHGGNASQMSQSGVLLHSHDQEDQSVLQVPSSQSMG